MIHHELKQARYSLGKTLLWDFLVPLTLVCLLSYYVDRVLARRLIQYLIDLPIIGYPIYRSPFFHWYVTWHQFIFGGLILFFACGISYRTARIPGPGRAFRRFWQGLLFTSWKKDEAKDTFPPPFSRYEVKTWKAIRALEQSSPNTRMLGYYKRFVSDLQQDILDGKEPEKPNAFFPILLEEEQRYRHIQIVGGSGSGKSASLIAPILLADAASSSLATVTINPKADKYLLKVLATGAGRGKAPTGVISFYRKESLAYDPLLFGDADALTKKIIGSSDIAHPFYRSVQESWLMTFFRIMRTEPELDGKIMLKQLHRFLIRPKSLLETVQGLVKNNDNLAYLQELAGTNPDSLAGLASHIGCMVQDESLSHIFDNPGGRVLNIREIIRQGGNIFVEVDTSSKGPQARALGRMIMMEIQLLAGARQAGMEPNKVGVQVILDEFASFAYNGFIELLDKCRSARVGFLLSHQSLGNLKRENLAAAFKDEVVDNTHTKFLLAVKDETAEWASRQMGSRMVVKKSLALGQMTDKTHIHGRDNQTVSFREELEPYVQPAGFALGLGYGYGILEDSRGAMIKGLLRLGYVAEGELCSDAEFETFLQAALASHPQGLNGCALEDERPLGHVERDPQGVQRNKKDSKESSGNDQLGGFLKSK